MEEIEKLLRQYEGNRELELVERLIAVNRQIRAVMGNQFESQVAAWEEAFRNVMRSKECGIIEAAIMIARNMQSSGVPPTSICVIFACAVELLVVRGKYAH